MSLGILHIKVFYLCFSFMSFRRKLRVDRALADPWFVHR